MDLLALVLLGTLFLAYANGANDNFKGVATLYGSNTASYKTAITVATCATLAGSLASLSLAQELIVAFSGRGIVPGEVAASPIFLASVAIGASSTVILATVTGFPISTTHALVGSIVGAGFIAVGTALKLGVLGTGFIAPLLISPLVAIFLTMPLYWILHRIREKAAITTETCICIRPAHFVAISQAQFNPQLQQYSVVAPASLGGGIVVATQQECAQKYRGVVLGLSLQKLIDSCHYMSACAVSFARGLNDTPKIAGLLLVVQALDIRFGVLGIAAAMAIGGWLNARKVAHTMSKKVSRMNDGQALTANLVTAFLVIFASRLGLPVSTTHVSVGAISGVGIINGTADKKVISGILLSWVLTLPIAAAIAAASYAVLRAWN